MCYFIRMKKNIFLIFNLILISVMTTSAQTEKQKSGIENAVKKVLSEQTRSWNECDIENFMQGYWKSENLSFTSGNKNTRGWQATLDNYKKGYADCDKMGKLSFSELDVEVLSKSSALVRGRFLLERKTDRPTGLFTLIFRKFKDGWKIIHDHTSS